MRTAKNLLLRTLLVLAALNGCKNDGESASGLYEFDGTKPVAVRVNVDYKLDGSVGPSVTIDERRFLLNAFLSDDSATQVAIKSETQAAAFDLPVSLDGTHLEFDAVVMIPAKAEPGTTGYTLHFALIEQGSSLALTSTQEDVKNLDALRDGVQPGVEAAANPVHMSLATTVAYQIAQEMNVLPGADGKATSYQSLLDLVRAQVASTEDTLDATKTTDLTTFAAAVIAGLKLKLTADQDLQAQVAGIVQAANTVERTSSDGTSMEQQFTQLLKTYSSDVKNLLGNNDTAAAQIFKANVITAADIPNPETYVGIVYAPAALTFKDVDITDAIGGNAVVTPPKVGATIEAYNVYFGANTMTDSRLELVGSVTKGTSPLQVAIGNGSKLPGGATRFWVFPVINGQELDLGASCLIVNVSTPAGLKYAQPTAIYTANSAIEANSPSSTGGRISTYTVSPALPTGLTLNAKTGVISGVPTIIQSAATYTVTGSNGSASTNATVSIEVRVAPPAGLSYGQPSPTYTAGSAIAANQPSSTGGAVASYGVAPPLPAGLALDATTGIITGRPTTAQAAKTYTVTGTNAAASTSTTVVITVQPPPPATVTLSAPAAIKSNESFVLSGTCSGELGTISIDVGNDHVATAGVAVDPLSCTCEDGTFACPAETISYATFVPAAVSYKTTITSAWAGTASQTLANATTILELTLDGAASIDDGDTFDPSGTCSPNGVTVTLTAPSGFTPASESCTCAAHNINACGTFTELTATANTALTLTGSLTSSSLTKTATQTLTVVNQPPTVMSSQSGVGNAYQASQLGGLSFTRYGHNVPSGNQVSHDEMMDFIDDPIGNADGIRANGTTAQQPYGYGGSSTPGWAQSDANDKYADGNGEITPVGGGDFFGDTYRGYFVPPEDGLYKFSNLYTPDNADRFMLAPNECPHKAVAVVSSDLVGGMGALDPVSTWIAGNNGQYDGNSYLHDTAAFFAGGSGNVNYAPGVVYLLASRIYYLEIRYAEGGGGNAFAFGVDFKALGEASFRGITNLKAVNMLPYSGADQYVPREACQGAYDTSLLFSDPEGDVITYGAYLVANDGSALTGTAAELATIGLSVDATTGVLTGTLNGNFTNQKIVFTATDATGSRETSESAPTTMYP